MLTNNRIELHNLLLTFCDNVYYQPPENLKMTFPAIVYTRSNIHNEHASDNIYRQLDSYTVTVIDKNPDSNIVRNISKIKYCSFNRHFISDNLNHDVFNLYY